MSRTNRAASEKKKSIQQLSHHVHSASQTQCEDAIERLGALKDPDAARELIQFFDECGWRSTQLKIISALALHPTERSLHFLFRLASQTQDIPFADAAIKSLGKTQD